MLYRFKKNIIEFLNEIIFRIDTTKYIIDKPKFDYQPLPWIGIHQAGIRGDATEKRWMDISRLIGPGENSLKDIGCCVGYFCHSAVEDRGMHAIGIDMDPRFLRIANYTKTRLKGGKNESFFNLEVNLNSVSLLPLTDVTILFSVWHHWVLHLGLNDATSLLKKVWATTNSTLFFESGEEEVADEFNLPFNGRASDWLEEYLKDVLENSAVLRVGQYEAGSYSHYKIKNHKRTVFQVKKG